MVFYQTRKAPRSEKGNKVIINDIEKSSINVFFETDDLKQSILKGEENPNNFAFLVDVKIETISEKISFYRVLKLHEIIPIE